MYCESGGLDSTAHAALLSGDANIAILSALPLQCPFPTVITAIAVEGAERVKYQFGLRQKKNNNKNKHLVAMHLCHCVFGSFSRIKNKMINTQVLAKDVNILTSFAGFLERPRSKFFSTSAHVRCLPKGNIREICGVWRWFQLSFSI